jgi:hypothetical protein
MTLTQSHDGSASDTSDAGVSDANLVVARDTATIINGYITIVNGYMPIIDGYIIISPLLMVASPLLMVI